VTVRPDTESVDDLNGLVARRLVVGALDTNCWILFRPRSDKAIIIDPGDEPQRIIDACSDLKPLAVVLSHQHWDHVLALPDVADEFGIEVYAHPDDSPVWPHERRYLATHGRFDAGTATADLLACGCHLGAPRDRPLWEGLTRDVGAGWSIDADGLVLRALHTPGHTPGSISLATSGHVFTGDTLFPGGPGLTGWPLSDFDTIIGSIRTKLFTLPNRTKVHPGHGRSTTIGDERPQLSAWIDRGW